jgi:hypothetical protein
MGGRDETDDRRLPVDLESPHHVAGVFESHDARPPE